MRRFRALALAVTGIVLATLLSTGSPASAAGNDRCGGLAAGYDPQHLPDYDHVVVLMEENWGYQDFVSSTKAPYLSGLARDCGAETNFHAATRPSQPNYMAATSGTASGVADRSRNDNVFHQLLAAGASWRSYEESMPATCSGSSRGSYKPGHNPAFWYTDLRTPTNTCAQFDVPLQPALGNDLAADSLPSFAWITPNYCHDFHWSPACPGSSSARVSTGDAWLADLLPMLTNLPSYRSGKTLIVITFDEGSGSGSAGVDCTQPSFYRSHPGCHIPAVVVSPYIVPGTTDASDQNLYSLLATTEDILGVPRLDRAVGQPSMRPGLRF